MKQFKEMIRQGIDPITGDPLVFINKEEIKMKNPRTIYYCEYCNEVIQDISFKGIVSLGVSSSIRQPGNNPIHIDGYYCDLSCVINRLRSLKETK